MIRPASISAGTSSFFDNSGLAFDGQSATMTGEGSKENGHGHAMYHLKFDEYVPLGSEDSMRSYSTPMTHSRPSIRNASPSRPPASETPPPTTSATTSTSRNESPTRQRAPPTPVNPTRGRFVQLKALPKSLSQDYAYGIIHLYRDLSGLGDADLTSIGRRPGSPEEENTLAILAVPSYMTANDFMGFVGEAQKDQVSHFRMIRTEAANRYMVLLKFRTNEAAKVFHSTFNGKAFNSMEPETCHVVFVKSVTFQASSTTTVDTVFPFIDDPFLPPGAPSPSDPTRPAPPPTPALRELPTCPVCLERMDASVTGLLTILCQHTFHCQCLTKWGDGSCPICRYSQKRDAPDQTHESHRCKTCDVTEDLWICLICGHIGCGRYTGAHAFDHHLQTNHLYALELETQRVWDYAGDGYVHRLIQTKTDGKLVEFPPISTTGPLLSSTGTYYYPADRSAPEDDVAREKMDAMGMEYTYLLTSQLDSQRVYYEEMIAAAADKASTALKSVDVANAEIERLEGRLQDSLEEVRRLKSELRARVSEEGKACERAELKLAKLGETARAWQKELKEERTLSEGLLVKVNALTKENEGLKGEKAELQEQNQDLMFMLENMGREDIKGGDLGVSQAKTRKKGTRRGKD